MSHPIISFIPIFSIFWQENTQCLVVNRAHWTKILLTTHLGTSSIFAFTEKILWIISLILKISSLLPPGSFGGPDTDLKLDIMKLNSYIIQLTVYLCIFWYIENIRYEIINAGLLVVGNGKLIFFSQIFPLSMQGCLWQERENIFVFSSFFHHQCRAACH